MEKDDVGFCIPVSRYEILERGSKSKCCSLKSAVREDSKSPAFFVSYKNGDKVPMLRFALAEYCSWRAKMRGHKKSFECDSVAFYNAITKLCDLLSDGRKVKING